MKDYLPLLLLILNALCLTSCKTDYANLPTYTINKQLQAVIEVPAGNNHKLQYNLETREFENKKVAGQDYVARYLPYPGNLGFIPSTEVSSNGRGLEVLVISERVEPGTVMEITPIAVLQLETTAELKSVIIAVPARPSEQTFMATDYESFSKEYPAAKDILKAWFVHYNANAQTKFVAWRDEAFAKQEIQRWMKL
ncbi:inorganic diphosphatase [Pontibacter silvestris]|uniref:inorganic diphosphatase n=1 Tax=Pontibacter silvestris TaxID=2305183 RepID=A0ABW4X377_9BACT|nr:inorganic diphosphatase [Pontibacter silvestris]MCC9137919.1 inorganic diphosphatase [Pontibacter silvestris]